MILCVSTGNVSYNDFKGLLGKFCVYTEMELVFQSQK